MANKKMIIEGLEYIETPEGYVRSDIIDDAKPHKVQLLVAGICTLYSGLVGTVIYQIKYPQTGDVIGVFSYNLLLITQQLLGEAVLVAVPVVAALAVYILFVRIDVATKITKAIMLGALVIWICAAFALLYGLENNPTDNLVGRYSVGISINMLGKPATFGLYWTFLLYLVISTIEKNTGWSVWDSLNDRKKKALIKLNHLQHQIIENLPSISTKESIVPNSYSESIQDFDDNEKVAFDARISEFRRRFEKSMPVKKEVQPVSKNHEALEQANLGELILVIDWLKVGGLALLSAEAGVGKTRLLVALACAIASGQDFLGWRVYGARKVLYVDGEMGMSDMRDRIRSLGTAPSNLILLTYDMYRDDEVPNICTNLGQSLIERELLAHKMSEGSVIILDSLLTLSQEQIDYPKAHATYQNWLLRLRERGYTVLAAHHTNKQGQQSGSNKKNTLLNTSILMTRPKGYTQNGFETRAEIEFKKCRDSHGVDISPSTLVCCDGIWTRKCQDGNEYSWSVNSETMNNNNELNMKDYSSEYAVHKVNIQDIQVEKNLNNSVIALSGAGKTQLEIANELNISQSKVSRILAKAS